MRKSLSPQRLCLLNLLQCIDFESYLTIQFTNHFHLLNIPNHHFHHTIIHYSWTYCDDSLPFTLVSFDITPRTLPSIRQILIANQQPHSSPTKYPTYPLLLIILSLLFVTLTISFSIYINLILLFHVISSLSIISILPFRALISIANKLTIILSVLRLILMALFLCYVLCYNLGS